MRAIVDTEPCPTLYESVAVSRVADVVVGRRPHNGEGIRQIFRRPSSVVAMFGVEQHAILANDQRLATIATVGHPLPHVCQSLRKRHRICMVAAVVARHSAGSILHTNWQP